MRSDDLSPMIVTNSTAVAFSFIYGLPLMTPNAVLWHFQSRSRAQERGSHDSNSSAISSPFMSVTGLRVYGAGN